MKDKLPSVKLKKIQKVAVQVDLDLYGTSFLQINRNPDGTTETVVLNPRHVVIHTP